MKRFEFLEAADADLAETVNYYDACQENLGSEFLDEVKRTLRRIAEYPDAWPHVSKSVRRCQTNRFPYGILYQEGTDVFLVVAVMHLHAEPESWRKRTPRPG